MGELGFIGLGKLGTPLLKKMKEKYRIKGVCSRNSGKASLHPDIKFYEEPFQIASNCDIIFIMVSDDSACESVIFGEKGLIRTIRPKSIVINLSTVSHKFTMSAEKRLQESMCSYLDTPVFGSIRAAEEGRLIVLASGNEEAFHTVEAVLNSFSIRVVYMGKSGNATKMKLISNMAMASNLAIASEALFSAENAGIPRELAMDILLSGGSQSRILEMKKDAILKEDFIPDFTLKDMIKDLDYAMDLSMSLKNPVPLGASAMQFYIAASSIGFGNLDYSSVSRVYKFLAGRS